LKIAEMPPTVNVTSPVEIILSINETNRDYLLGVNIMPGNGTDIISINAIIYPYNTTQNIAVNGATITIPMPSNASTFVEVL